jgi:predicted alpha/beta superfamily hydrolase
MKKKLIIFITTAFVLLCTYGMTLAQEKSDSLYSNILKEKRFIQVFLPANYQAGTKYDVLYVLDGEMLSRFVTPIRSFAEENELIPPIIIIGIKNNYWYNINQDSRDRDLLPQKVDGSPLSGGADNFLSFLKNELMPYVGSHYSTSGKNILFGHSYAGLFTMYTFLTQPELFDSYIASDPALWWNEGYVNKLAEKSLVNFTKSKRTLFIGGRSGGIYEAFGIKTMDSILRKKAPTNLIWQSISSPDEHHGSVRLKNIYDGLKFTYFGYSSFMLDFFPMDGILLKGKPVPILLYSTYLEYNPGIRYTIDGSEPLPTSTRYDYGIQISAPAVFTLKQFSNYGTDKITRGHFILGNVFPPVQKPLQFSPGGFHYAYYKSDSSQVSSSNINPLQQGITDKDFNINNFDYKAPFSCIIDGYLEAEKDGYYIFFLESDYLAKLLIGDKLLITIDRSHEETGSKSYVVPLAKGFYPIRMEYAHKTGDRNFSLTYMTPVAKTDERLAHLPINIPLRLQYGKINK